MITNLSPALKQHIEMNIDDIEKGNLTNSIYLCSLDILYEYTEALRAADILIPLQLKPFIDICCSIANTVPGTRLDRIEFLTYGEETYEFILPLKDINYYSLIDDIRNCYPEYYITYQLDINYCHHEVRLSICSRNIITPFKLPVD